jgi:tetratricopeptide (TPR) repeat protein
MESKETTLATPAKLELANQLSQEFYAACFWHLKPNLAGKKEHDKAIADYTEAIRLKPDYARAYYNRGLAYQRKEDGIRAKADLDKAISLDPLLGKK